MKLRELFEKDIDRNINGVVKVEQVNNEDLLKQELEEFVITKELREHFSNFYERYNTSLNRKVDEMGVWISGFFGSGKSHFLKILSYLLENKEVGGKSAVDYFDNKNLDTITLSNIKRATTVPTETILFNIDSQSSKDSKNNKDGIVEIFLKVFNKRIGYCAEIAWLANLERTFDKDGIYNDFKKAFKEVSGCEWVDVRGEYAYRKDEFVKALMQVKNISEQSARELIKDSKSDYSMSPDSFAKLIKEYLDSKGSKNRIIFLVDEIGQFISDNSELMLSLQTIVENLGSMCSGRAWVMVTSQEAIDTITKERFRDQDFSKIQGRFDTRLKLSGANTDEVIKKRLLAKRETAKQVLNQHFNEQEKILDNLITFSSHTAGMKSYQTADDYIDCYPFIPYQFNLLQNVFASLRKFSHAGAHLADSERSMLNAFHAALMEYGDKEITELVPFNVFYSTIKTFIDSEIVRIIEQAPDGNDDIDDFDVKVLIILFLIKYIKEVPCDVENIATLMVSNINDSKNTLKSKIESALTRLKKATLIQENGDIYNFLTNDEQEISRGIQRTQIDSDDVLNKVYTTIFGEILNDKRSVTPIKDHTYYYTRRVDDIVRGSQIEDTEIKFITSMNPDHQWGDNELKLKCSANNILYIKLKDNGYLTELETILKTEKYMKHNSGVSHSEAQNIIINSKASEIRERTIRVQKLLEQAIMESTFYTAGDIIDVQATSAVAKIENSMKVVVENTYNRLNYMVEHVSSINEIYKNFSSPQTKLSDPNQRAIDELMAFLNMQSQMNCAVTMQTLKTRYTKQPYGWAMLDIAAIIADLAGNNKITINYNGANINRGDVNITRYLTNDKEIQSTEIKIKTQIDNEKVRQVISIVRDLFEKTDIQEDGEKLAEQIKKDFIPSLVNELQVIESRYTNDKYPNKSVIEAGIEVFKKLKEEPDTNIFFDKLIQKSNDLNEWYGNFKLVRSFFNSQIGIFDNALNALKLVKDNEICLSMIHSDDVNLLNEKAKEIQNIVELSSPYAEIKNLPPITESVNEIFNTLLKSYKDAIGEVISDHAYYLAEEATKSNLDSNKYSDIFKREITSVYESLNEFSGLNALSQKSEQLYNSLLKQINDDLIAQTQTPTETTGGEENPTPQPPQKQLVFTKPASISDKPILETEEDVDNYINKLSAELKAQIRDNKKIKLQ